MARKRKLDTLFGKISQRDLDGPLGYLQPEDHLARCREVGGCQDRCRELLECVKGRCRARKVCDVKENGGV